MDWFTYCHNGYQNDEAGLTIAVRQYLERAIDRSGKKLRVYVEGTFQWATMCFHFESLKHLTIVLVITVYSHPIVHQTSNVSFPKPCLPTLFLIPFLTPYPPASSTGFFRAAETEVPPSLLPPPSPASPPPASGTTVVEPFQSELLLRLIYLPFYPPILCLLSPWFSKCKDGEGATGSRGLEGVSRRGPTLAPTPTPTPNEMAGRGEWNQMKGSSDNTRSVYLLIIWQTIL
ncbi:hypothetical protein V1478_013150 [Vespula squamosa]|uniref:Uncharacterized protein n=1 Tax=Vespula squamosa TaxID=30214 RepID=A0ABD2AA63_VESSQ